MIKSFGIKNIFIKTIIISKNNKYNIFDILLKKYKNIFNIIIFENNYIKLTNNNKLLLIKNNNFIY